MTSQQKVEVNVADRKLSIACPKGQETALTAAADELNRRLSLLSPKSAIKSPEQTLLLTALNLANDFLQQQEIHEAEKQQLQGKIDLLQNTIKTAVQRAHDVRAEQEAKIASNG